MPHLNIVEMQHKVHPASQHLPNGLKDLIWGCKEGIFWDTQPKVQLLLESLCACLPQHPANPLFVLCKGTTL